jgi:hypothetical protein
MECEDLDRFANLNEIIIRTASLNTWNHPYRVRDEDEAQDEDLGCDDVLTGRACRTRQGWW